MASDILTAAGERLPWGIVGVLATTLAGVVTAIYKAWRDRRIVHVAELMQAIADRDFWFAEAKDLRSQLAKANEAMIRVSRTNEVAVQAAVRHQAEALPPAQSGEAEE